MTGFVMGDHFMEDTPMGEGCSQTLIKLTKDKRIISCAACVNPPSQMPAVWDITSIVRKDKVRFLSSLPGFSITPACEDSHQEKEWGQFLDFLQKHNRVAISNFGLFELYILPPLEGSKYDLATVRFKGKASKTSPAGAGVADSDQISPPTSQSQAAKASSQLGNSVETVKSFQRNYVTAHPSYLKTLGQAHSSWIFGAVAELVDNARDAKATKLEIAINKFYSKIACKEIPMLSLIDDGHGMSHTDIQRMVSFGHGQTEVDDPNHIGMYGIGFKTGTMRLGKDALVLTQTTNSRSIAFLSQSLNEGKDNLEIPIVSYRRVGQSMEVDTDVQNKDAAKLYLKIIKRYSPFDKYLIGEKVGIFGADGTGTQIYIWNLDEWGSDYSLKWEAGFTGGSSFHRGGIFIRSRRTRCRPGQMSLSVPLDYCLKSYLEVIFLDPRMKIYVQGALVRSRPLAKSLSKTTVENGTILGKPVQLTLGRSQLEWEQANSGIFLYWHGRLIEAYKRVGSMIHNGDCGRGIIGVADVTKIMDDENGCVWVHSNKQGFQDCEAYVELEQWLGEKANEYIDKYVDKIQLRKGNASVKPDHEWVQCDKCRKWRMLSADFDSKTLPSQWFCYMKPFNGLCDTPEESITSGTITISTKRHGYNTKDPRNGFREREAFKSEGISSNYASDSEEDDEKVSVKRQMRSSLPRLCKKN
ncbi:ATPase MORC2-like [Salvia splendens]|uniref:ATPase MORC2-like n=2 Tax=Salvia splendens TaxID=180675 RepID=UPI001C264E98|nr:ATPase MORC2-like [Salvia splendens]